MKTLLIATACSEDVETIRRCFGGELSVIQSRELGDFVSRLSKHSPDLAFLDVRLLLGERTSMTKEQHREIVRTCWEASSNGPLIVLAPASLTREAVKAVQVGASNYLTSPVDPTEAVYITESLQEFEIVRAELAYLRDHFWSEDSLAIAKTDSRLMQAALENIRRVAPTSTTVLLTGETGVGKSTLAKLIHRHSQRREQPFISVHCGAIPNELLESELFGHERGAFTGAFRKKLGKFEVAQSGTIFLDEVGLLSASAQIKLLSVIQERTLQRVGSEHDISVDVRIIAASNDDLKELSERGLFRRDLFFRLNVFPIEIPPLRERIEDLPHLTRSILERLRQGQAKPIVGVTPEVLEAFRRYSWPGNVRELENLIERAFILEEGEHLSATSFPADLFPLIETNEPGAPEVTLPLNEFRHRSIEELERRYLLSLLERHNGKLHETAAAAGIGLRQLYKLLSKHNIRQELRRLRA